MPKLNNQHFLIIEYLKQGHTLTPLEAIKVAGSMKLSTRVGELRKLGYDIKDEWLKLENGKKVKKYWLNSLKLAPEITPEPKEAIDLRGFVEAKSTNSQNPVDIALNPQKPTEGLETQNSEPVYFEKEGQLLFLGEV
jgi:hypothetical protein